MPISKENLDRINHAKSAFQDQVLWLGRKGITDTSELIDRIRDVRQFTIGLSVAIIGISFPQILTKSLVSEISDFFLISLFLFTLNIVIGLLTLFTSAHKEYEEMPLLTNHNANEIIKIINELEEIKKIENNDEAGRKFKELQKRSTLYPMKPLNLVQHFWLKYQDLIIFSLFLCGFIFLIIGFLLNLNFK